MRAPRKCPKEADFGYRAPDQCKQVLFQKNTTRCLRDYSHNFHSREKNVGKIHDCFQVFPTGKIFAKKMREKSGENWELFHQIYSIG